ncbi:MAG: hypothetical protein R2742_15080 [Micropruina glycogenica]
MLVARDFSIGGVLMMRFAELAAPFYESVEVIELPSPQQGGRPLGHRTQHATRIAPALPAGIGLGRFRRHPATRSRAGASVDGIPVHAVRQRGLFANQQVLFGNEAEALNIVPQLVHAGLVHAQRAGRREGRARPAGADRRHQVSSRAGY